jgi:hypothetical protein
MQIGYVQLANVHINDKIYPRVCRRKRKIYQIGCNFSSHLRQVQLMAGSYKKLLKII